MLMQKGVYTEDTAEDFLRTYVPVAKHLLTDSFDDAAQAVKKLGFPAVLKIISPDALHKSDIGGVRFVKNIEELREQYQALLEVVHKRKLHFEGILVQEYIEGTY